jgi:4-amino-4-deoxy-L-arabinose transferase-like glycosyltransferase
MQRLKEYSGWIVLVLAILLVPMGIWGPGLWDPWEMNPAFVARRLADAPVVLVAEGRSRSDSASMASLLASDLADLASVEATSDSASAGSAIEAVRTRLGDRVYRVAVLDVDARVKSDADADGIRTLSDLLLAVEPLNRSTAFVLVSSSGNIDVSKVKDRLLQRAGSAERDDPDAASRVESATRAVVARADLASVVREALPGDGFLAQFKSGGRTMFVPPLEPFLVSVSLRAFGMNEFAARLPAALLTMLTLCLVFLGVRKAFGEIEAILAVVVMVTSPLVLLSGRFVGDHSAIVFAVALAGVAFGAVVRGMKGPWPLATLLAALVLAWLSGGMLAVTIVAAACVTFVLVSGRHDTGILIAAGAVALLAGVLALATFVPECAFVRQFRFTASTFTSGIKDDGRTFEVAIKALGFGLFPWAALLPLAVKAAAGGDPKTRSERLVVLLWGIAPFIALMVAVRPYHQATCVGAPALAVLIALYLRGMEEDPVESRLLAFVGFGLVLVLFKDISRSPAPLVSWLTTDPTFSEPGKGDLSFPELVSLPILGKAFAILAGMSLLVAGGRLVSAVRALPGLLRRRKTFAIVMVVMAGLIVVDLAIFLALKWDTLGGSSGPDAQIGPMLLRIFLTGPDIMGLYLLTGFLIATRYADRLRGIAVRLLGEGRVVSAGGFLLGLERPRASAGMMAVGAIGVALVLAFQSVPELSWHLSQKHMVEKYRESAASAPGDIYRHGVFAAKGSEDSNFYTGSIPEMSSRTQVLDRLKDASRRTFFLVPKNQWSEILSAFRSANSGAWVPVLDDRSSRFVLVASSLASGEEDRDWIRKATLTQSGFEALKDVNPTMVNFDDKIQVVGWEASPSAVRRGGKVTLRTYFKVLEKIPQSYRIFLHVDRVGSSSRMHGDHWIRNQARENEEQTACVGCYATTHWQKGDIVVDSYELEVPIGTPSGPYDIWMGFYNPSGDKRLPVKDFDKEKVRHDGQNRVRTGSLTVQ